MKRITRHKSATLNLPTLRLEGGLFLPDVLEKAALGTGRRQTDADYGTPKGLKQKDEYSRSFQIASALWRHFSQQVDRSDVDASHATAMFVSELLRAALGYPVVSASSGITVGDRDYPITHIASNGQGAQLPLVIAPHDLGLDEPDVRFGIRHADGTNSGTRKKSAFQLLQELLNASPDHRWGIATNGRTIRLARDAATLTRPSYLDIDLADILGGQRYSEFIYAWRLLHASRAGLLPGSDGSSQAGVVWEVWREAGQEEGTRVREGLRLGVTQALLTFGNGFIQHPANDALRLGLQSGTLRKEDFFAQLLRLIYRLIFVFSVEERGLLPTNSAYVQGYALARLRDLAVRRRARTRFDDYWKSVRIVFRGMERGEPRLGLPALGGLFDARQCPLIDASELTNADLLAAMQSLRWAPQAGGSLAPIDFRNMDVEELGSVYESLLELVPEIDLPARTFGFIGLTSVGSTSGNERKLTGSYYTPSSLVQELINSALVPVIEDRINRRPDDPIAALLSIKVCDPACGSGHFLLAAARKLAERLAVLRSEDGVVTPAAYRHALREVIGNCIFGVDRNPMAIELARTALWLESFEEGRPLSFLDHHLQVGDALLGISNLNSLTKGIPAEAFKALSLDEKGVCKDLSKANQMGLRQLERDYGQGQKLLDFADGQMLQQALKALDDLPSETPEQVAVKEATYREILASQQSSRLSKIADLVLAAFLLPKTLETQAVFPTSQNLHAELSQSSLTAAHERVLQVAHQICRQASVFHWPLAFPQIFSNGGFDCMLGNPPWEMLQLDPQEFFAFRAPEIANAKHMTARDKLIRQLERSDPQLFSAYSSAIQQTEAAQSFVHFSGRFPASGFGRLNLAYLFAELFLDLKDPSGRSGLVVPSGVATDSFSQHLFNKIADGSLISYLDFENSEAIFPGVHRSTKFCLLTLGSSAEAAFSCFLKNVDQLTDDRRKFTLQREDFELLNPNTGTCPIFRTSRDAEITKKIYRSMPVLWREKSDTSEEVNPWGLKFMLMFMMNTDSHLFKDEPARGRMPLLEAKLIHQFDHRWATYTPAGESRDCTLLEKQNPRHFARPRYWVEEPEVLARVADIPGRVAKSWIALESDARPEAEAPIAKSLKFAVASWVASSLFRDALAMDVLVDQASDDDLAKALHLTQQILEERFAPLLRVLKAGGIDGVAAKRSFLSWAADDRGVAPLQIELVEIESWIQEVSSNPNSKISLRSIVGEWMQRRSPRWLIGWRDITNSTNERTLIASVFKLAAVGNQMPLVLFPLSADRRRIAAFYASLCSLVFDFVARQKTGGTHMNYFVIKQLPILPPERYTDDDLNFIVPRVLELTYTAEDLASWAEDLGYSGQPFAFEPERRSKLRAELDARFARLYGISREELRYILDPADVMGDDYPSETFRVLKNKEKSEFGEHRTRRLVLEAWDALEKGTLQ